jgi:hypothetical protein
MSANVHFAQNRTKRLRRSALARERLEHNEQLPVRAIVDLDEALARRRQPRSVSDLGEVAVLQRCPD